MIYFIISSTWQQVSPEVVYDTAQKLGPLNALLLFFILSLSGFIVYLVKVLLKIVENNTNALVSFKGVLETLSKDISDFDDSVKALPKDLREELRSHFKSTSN